MTKTRRIVAIALVVVASGAAGWLLAGGAWADGPPATPGSLFYAGELTNADGTPYVGGPLDITVSLWSHPTMPGAAFELCRRPETMVAITNGHFRIPLDPMDVPDCVDAIRENPDVWVQVQVGADPALPRTKIGTVPYAIEADRAQRVTRSSAAGTTSVSTAGAFCGYTVSETEGLIAHAGLTGYAAARSLCGATCGSPTAHICTAAEMSLSAQLGLPAPAGGFAWFSSDRAYEVYPGVGDTVIDDCNGWTYDLRTEGARSRAGPVWNRVGARSTPGWDTCDRNYPVACCD